MLAGLELGMGCVDVPAYDYVKLGDSSRNGE